MNQRISVWLLHGGLIAALLVLHFTLPTYHHGNIARIMVLASFAIGYNIMFGFTGLLSLGHALFFAAGMYGMALPLHHLNLPPTAALLAGAASSALVGTIIGLLALRTRGVAFMIVTLMFAQAGYLTVLLFGEFTRGDEGFVIREAQRTLFTVDMTDPGNRYIAALTLFSLSMIACLAIVQHPFGKVLIAIRENEERASMLGYDCFRHKLAAIIISAVLSGSAGAVYALLFGYAGATFASVQYSILPLLWVLLGGAGTVVGPFIGTLFMFYLIDISSGFTTANMLIAGIVLVLLTLMAPQGLCGEVRKRWIGWLP